VLININLEEGTPATKIAPQIGLETRSLTPNAKDDGRKGIGFSKKPDLVDNDQFEFISHRKKESGKKEIPITTIREFLTSRLKVSSARELDVFFFGIREDPKANSIRFQSEKEVGFRKQ